LVRVSPIWPNFTKSFSRLGAHYIKLGGIKE
jgi:hypothetical protein